MVHEHSAFLVLILLAWIGAAATGAFLFVFWRTGVCALSFTTAALASQRASFVSGGGEMAERDAVDCL